MRQVRSPVARTANRLFSAAIVAHYTALGRTNRGRALICCDATTMTSETAFAGWVRKSHLGRPLEPSSGGLERWLVLDGFQHHRACGAYGDAYRRVKVSFATVHPDDVAALLAPLAEHGLRRGVLEVSSLDQRERAWRQHVRWLARSAAAALGSVARAW